MTNLYKVKVSWYDTVTDTNQEDKCLIFATSISKVGEKLEKNFEYIDKVKIEEVCVDIQDGVLWLPAQLTSVQDLIEFNNY